MYPEFRIYCELTRSIFTIPGLTQRVYLHSGSNPAWSLRQAVIINEHKLRSRITWAKEHNHEAGNMNEWATQP